MIFHDIDQNTEEWLQLRSAKVTGSGVSKIMANLGKAFGDPAKKYASQIALERITGKYISSGYSNDHMDRGHEQEPLARTAYEEKHFCTVTNGGFFDLDDLGCSPDGLVDDDGMIEIKSVIPSVHFVNVKRQSFDPAYEWQLIFNLKCTGREWIDSISYCADYPDDQNLFVFRLHKDHFKKEFDLLDGRIKDFLELVEESKQAIMTSKYFIRSR